MQLALIQIDTANYGWIRSYYDRIQDLLAAEPQALFGLQYTFGDHDAPVGTRVRIEGDTAKAASLRMRRQLRRAERLSDRLRSMRHNCGLELRAALPGNDRSLRYALRYADLSSRLALVDSIATILRGGDDR
jgi:hypothetical protein